MGKINEINNEAGIVLKLLSQNKVESKVCEDTFIDSPNRNMGCVYSYGGFNHLICLREGNEGDYCQYWKNCRDFIKRSVNNG